MRSTTRQTDTHSWHTSRLAAAVMLLAIILLTAACSPAAGTTTSTERPTAGSSSTTAASASSDAETTTEPGEGPAKIRVAALRGPTGIGLARMMHDQEEAGPDSLYSFYLTGTPDDIVARISSGQADVAALPTNMASILYQRTNKSIRMLAVNTLGVLYVLEQGDTVQSLADLAGREILATGQGAVPEYALAELLGKAGLAEPATVIYKGEHEELAALAAAGQAGLLMLPEPFVTTVLSKNPNLRIAIDLTEAWQDVHADQDESELAMGGLVVQADFAADHPDALMNFLADYDASVSWVNANPAEAGELVAQYKIMADAALAAKAIPNCNIVLIHGDAMRQILEPFFAVLFAANPKSIGGQMPDDAFYWMP